MDTDASAARLDLQDPFTRGLACAAICPGLRSILVLDRAPAALLTDARLLAGMLHAATGRAVVLLLLGFGETEDDLWGGWTLDGSRAAAIGPRAAWRRGLLSGTPDDARLSLVLIPNLAHLSLVAARACVMLMGAEVAHLERHGRREHWRPDLCWLAACASEEIGQVSPHLLDRFALRLRGSPPGDGNRAMDVLAWTQDLALPKNDPTAASLPAEIGDRLREAVRRWPEPTGESVERVLTYLPDWEGRGARRAVTLTRLALAQSRLDDGTEWVTADHVEAAAGMLGLAAEDTTPSSTAELPPHSPAEPIIDALSWQESEEEFVEGMDQEERPTSGTEMAPVYQPSAVESAQVNLPNGSVYVEDDAPAEREAASLRLPLQRSSSTAAARGVIVGVERSTSLHDLALVSTFLEAAKFQRVRRKQLRLDTRPRMARSSKSQEHSSLLLSPTDLRRYRRAPSPEQMLVLLMDYTCLRGDDWQEALLPYLKWAYVKRAGVCVVQVGAAGAANELQARRVLGQNLLVPRVGAALEATPGRATPLAHGLDLALQTLRHALQHGRAVLRDATFIVLSDGRGNVPLEASRAGRIMPPVNREGIEDSLRVAEQLRDLGRLRIVLLDPQPDQYADLPLALAAALGAQVEPIRPPEPSGET